ncbi:unnamed protein product [Caenorhabditis nigoni]
MESSSSPTYIELQSRKTGEKSKCAICDDAGDGFHFGAEACRACAAFFRRTIALGKEYECRQHGHCTVNTIVRSICKFCRLQKCLKVGMKSTSVQPKRDICKRKEDGQLSQSAHSTSMEDSSQTSVSVPPTLDAMSKFARMKECYEKLENARNVVHRGDGDNIFERKTRRPLNFHKALDCLSKEIPLVADWIDWCFDEFRFLPADQKNLLYMNFSPLFIVLEQSYLTSKYGGENQLVLASGDYVDVSKLEEFFTDPVHGICGKKLAKIFGPSLELNISFHKLLRDEKVELYDFFALTVSLFWDHGLVGQSEECRNIARKMKTDIVKEYTYYLRHFKGVEDPIGEMALKISILTSLQAIFQLY